MMVVMVPARVDDADVVAFIARTLAEHGGIKGALAEGNWYLPAYDTVRPLDPVGTSLSLCGGKYVVRPRSSRIAEAGSHLAKVQIPLQVVRSVGHGGVFKPEGFQNASNSYAAFCAKSSCSSKPLNFRFSRKGENYITNALSWSEYEVSGQVLYSRSALQSQWSCFNARGTRYQ